MKIRNIGSEVHPYVAVGRVIKPHGIRGEMKVYPYAADPVDFELCTWRHAVVLAGPDADPGAGRSFTVVHSHSRGKVVNVRLKEIESRTAAEGLRGFTVLVRKENLPPLGADEYYWHDLLGMRVRTVDSRPVGTVAALLTTRAHEILVVRGEAGREYLVPAKDEFIVRIEMAEKRMVISPPPGLLEMNINRGSAPAGTPSDKSN